MKDPEPISFSSWTPLRDNEPVSATVCHRPRGVETQQFGSTRRLAYPSSLAAFVEHKAVLEDDTLSLFFAIVDGTTGSGNGSWIYAHCSRVIRNHCAGGIEL
jgi:hypothetical protein